MRFKFHARRDSRHSSGAVSGSPRPNSRLTTGDEKLYSPKARWISYPCLSRMALMMNREDDISV